MSIFGIQSSNMLYLFQNVHSWRKTMKKYYKNSFGLDRKITARCLNLAAQCKKIKIPITTFMIASDPYLQRFVNEFTETNNGKAFFASLDHLGAFIFRDFESGKRKTVY